MEHWRDAVQDAIKSAGLSESELERFDDLWRDQLALREIVRPVVADIGETAQFLAIKQTPLTHEALSRFLDYLFEDLAAALNRLLRLSEGDYSPDKYRERFPIEAEETDSGTTPWRLFERWVAARKPAHGTRESWWYVFSGLRDHFSDRSAASIMPEEADSWIQSLISSERSEATVKRTWLNAAKTVFGWAVDHKVIPRNPFAGVKVTVPKKPKLRETRAFRPQEARTILQAASAICDTRKPVEAAKRWVPWLCAYTGARVGEMSQLRKEDVIEEERVPALRITPDAGTVKGNAARVVPLHDHLVAQGFLEFVEQHRDGPLFYKPDTSAPGNDLIKRKKPRYSQVRQRLADWVRGLGVTDPNISPNHAWRHTFKQVADRANITKRMSDYITGHAHKRVGAG